MSFFLLHALNAFFLVFHTGWVLFNVFGWMSPRTRRLNLITLGLTLFSWTVMGLHFGTGYCICTDWHWQVREALGFPARSDSYISFLISSLTPFQASGEWVRLLSAWVFAFCLAASLASNLADYRREHVKSPPAIP